MVLQLRRHPRRADRPRDQRVHVRLQGRARRPGGVVTEPNHGRASDGKRGCPVRVWDGPYVMRCDLGADAKTGRPTIGRCAYHGLFEQPTEESARLAAETETP